MANRFLMPTRGLLKYSKRPLTDCSEFVRILSISSSSCSNSFAPISEHSSIRKFHLYTNRFTESKDLSTSTSKDETVTDNKSDVETPASNEHPTIANTSDSLTNGDNNPDDEVIAFDHPISRFIATEEAKIKPAANNVEFDNEEQEGASSSTGHEPSDPLVSNASPIENYPVNADEESVSEEITTHLDSEETTETKAAGPYQNSSEDTIDESVVADYDQEKELPIVKLEILENALDFVTSHGWTRKSLSCGAEVAGYAGVAEGMFSNGGNDLLIYFIKKSNLELKEYLEEQSNMFTDAGERIPIRAFIRDAIEFRLRLIIPYIDAWPEAVSMLLHPALVAESAQLIGTMVDDVWFYAGDKSADFNWYTKRGILAKVYGATQLAMLSDDSPDFIDTWAFLDRQ